MRRRALAACAVLVVACAAACAAGPDEAPDPAPDRRPPRVVLILADDLGYGELGSYGQQKIRTPHLDRLAAQGMRFTQAYAGAPVCAPSRCVLLTGRHSAHAEVRGNREVQPEGQLALADPSPTLANLLRNAGYATAAVGKWGLGPVGSTGDPNARGFDLFYGYNCQREAHSYYPDHLWRNAERVECNGGERIPGHAKLGPDATAEDFARFRGTDYAPDLMLAEATRFLREHADEPFFLYLPLVEPHLAMQPPHEHVGRYPREWDDAPYLGTRGYTPHPRPRAGYAAMISDLDEHVGTILGQLDELGIADETLVLFTSDNGPTHDVGGVDTTFFASSGPLRGRKGSVYEGGLRVPLIVRWPGVVAAGSVSDHVCAFQDVLPTLLDAAQLPPARTTDGISFLATLTGERVQEDHAYLPFEFHGYGGQKAVRIGDWKAVQRRIHDGDTAIELYDLANDVGEAHDVAAEHPDLVARVRELFATERTPSEAFPMAQYD